MENGIKKYTHFDLSESTCGILTIEEVITKSLSIAEECAEETIDETVNHVHTVLGSTKYVAENLSVVRGLFQKCKDMNGSMNQKLNCINQVLLKIIIYNKALDSF